MRLGFATNVSILVLPAATLLFSTGLPGAASGEPRYSVNRDLTNCRVCHGDFRASTYTSLSDGGTWVGGLHDIHEDDMLDGDCETCHSPGPKFPVFLGSSEGGTGLDPISCSGCHGRAEDGTGTGSEGYGAGLRQHHWVNGITTCGQTGCHVTDSDPSGFTPVEEDVPPPYYSSSDPNHPFMPTEPCNSSPLFGEDYASTTLGTDNDGDNLYDELDVIPCPEPGEFLLMGAGLGLLGMLRKRA